MDYHTDQTIHTGFCNVPCLTAPIFSEEGECVAFLQFRIHRMHLFITARRMWHEEFVVCESLPNLEGIHVTSFMVLIQLGVINASDNLRSVFC
jgi:hypothetical protein